MADLPLTEPTSQLRALRRRTLALELISPALKLKEITMDHFHRRYRSASPQRRTTLDGSLFEAVCECQKSRCWKCLSASATLVLTESGVPIRTVVTGRRHQVTGVYASRKAGRALPYESMNERAFFMHSEVDTDVVDFRAQPFRLEFTVDGRPRAYIVDCVRQLACGTIELIEVKNDRRALRDVDYQLKLQCVRAICEEVGWQFRIILKQGLFEPEVRHLNVLDVQSWKLTDYSATDVFRVVDHLDRQPCTPERSARPWKPGFRASTSRNGARFMCSKFFLKLKL
jgi:hypothetical protein